MEEVDRSQYLNTLEGEHTKLILLGSELSLEYVALKNLAWGNLSTVNDGRIQLVKADEAPPRK